MLVDGVVKFYILSDFLSSYSINCWQRDIDIFNIIASYFSFLYELIFIYGIRRVGPIFEEPINPWPDRGGGACKEDEMDNCQWC